MLKLVEIGGEGEDTSETVQDIVKRLSADIDHGTDKSMVLVVVVSSVDDEVHIDVETNGDLVTSLGVLQLAAAHITEPA